MTEKIKKPKRKTRADRRNEARDNGTLKKWRKRQRVQNGNRGTQRVLEH